MENIAPQILPEAKRVKITYGPFKLRGTEVCCSIIILTIDGANSPPQSRINPGNTPSLDPAGTAFSDSLGPDFPRDIMVLSSVSKILNETFQIAQVTEGFYNHHAAFISFDKRSESWFTCGGKTVPDMTPYSIFMGAAAETIEIPLTAESEKVKSGFYIGSKDNLFVGVEFVNYNKEDRELYTVSELEYIPGRPADFAHGAPGQIPIGVCDGDQKSWAESMNIHAPAGQKSFTLGGKNDMEISKDGYLRTLCKQK
jgi:hypothetical protein